MVGVLLVRVRGRRDYCVVCSKVEKASLPSRPRCWRVVWTSTPGPSTLPSRATPCPWHHHDFWGEMAITYNFSRNGLIIKPHLSSYFKVNISVICARYSSIACFANWKPFYLQDLSQHTFPFPGLDLYVYRSCTTSHLGRLGSRFI